jgi:hypothetical protein
MKWILFAVIGLFTAPSVSHAEELVSMFTILGNPSAFDGKPVVVEGVLGVKGEVAVLYADHGSHDAGILINSFLITQFANRGVAGLDIDELRRMEGKYVAVWCKYFYSEPRSRAYTGALGDITRMALVPNLPAYSTAVQPPR